MFPARAESFSPPTPMQPARPGVFIWCACRRNRGDFSERRPYERTGTKGISELGMKLLTLVLLPLFSACALVAAPLPTFQKQVLSDKYFCDGVTAGDLNRDGRMDIIAGPYWYEGPDFK